MEKKIHRFMPTRQFLIWLGCTPTKRGSRRALCSPRLIAQVVGVSEREVQRWRDGYRAAKGRRFREPKGEVLERMRQLQIETGATRQQELYEKEIAEREAAKQARIDEMLRKAREICVSVKPEDQASLFSNGSK